MHVQYSNPKVTENNQVTLLQYCDTWITVLTTFLTGNKWHSKYTFKVTLQVCTLPGQKKNHTLCYFFLTALHAADYSYTHSLDKLMQMSQHSLPSRVAFTLSARSCVNDGRVKPLHTTSSTAQNKPVPSRKKKTLIEKPAHSIFSGTQLTSIF